MSISGVRWPGLAEKTILVTGGSRGIGRAIAEELTAAGARVVLTARSQETADAVANEIGAAASGLALDLSDSESAAATLKDWAREQKETGIHGVVLNAGMARDGLLMRMSLEQWDEVIRANLTGAYVVTKALVPTMIRARAGRVVAISSVVGRMGNAGQANYAAAKAGQLGFVRSLARELGPRGITVNAICPGYVDTEMTQSLGEEVRQGLLDMVPLGRLGQTADISAAVGFLLSDLAGYITGEVLDINGGMDM